MIFCSPMWLNYVFSNDNLSPIKHTTFIVGTPYHTLIYISKFNPELILKVSLFYNSKKSPITSADEFWRLTYFTSLQKVKIVNLTAPASRFHRVKREVNHKPTLRFKTCCPRTCDTIIKHPKIQVEYQSSIPREDEF